MSLLSFTQVQYLRNRMMTDRSTYLNNWRVRARWMSPNRFKNAHTQRNQGQRKDQDIINSQVRLSLRTFVSGMMNGATSRARPWFKLVAVDERQGTSTAARRWFAEVEKVILNHFQVSNLYRVLPSAYKDVGVFANAAYGMLPHPRFGFHFTPFMIGTYAFTNDSEGNVNTFMREFTLTVRQVVEIYGKKTPSGQIDWTHMDPWVQEAWEQARYTDEVKLVTMIVPNPAPKAQPLFPRDRAFQAYTYISGANANVPSQSATRANPSFEQKFIAITGYDYFPVICPRWEVAPEADYGDECPGDIAQGDVQMLQEMTESGLEAVDKLLRPPMIGTTALMRHQSSILAGGITYVDDPSDVSKQFKPAFQVDPKVGELFSREEKIEQAIRSAFFEDLFLMLANERQISHVTAREIEAKEAEKLSAIGPVLGQLDQDQNRPLIDNAFYILEKMGRLPQRPKDLEGVEIRPEYISILAQAQKASMITSSERLVQFVGATAQAFDDRSLLKLIKTEELCRQYADFVGVDPNLIRDELEFQQIRQQQAVLEAQARELQAQEQQAKTAKDLASSPTGQGTLLDQVVAQQATG